MGKQQFNMQKDIHFLKEKSYQQARDLAEIKKALLGDQYNPGFKQRIERVELKVKKQEVFAQRVRITAWALAGTTTLAGTVVTIIKNWSSIIF